MQAFRAQADAYGVHLELAVEHRAGCTAGELARALELLVAQARARLAAHDPTDLCADCQDCPSCSGGANAFPTESRVVIAADVARLLCTVCDGAGSLCPNLDTWRATT